MTQMPVTLTEPASQSESEVSERDSLPQAWNTDSFQLETAKGIICIQSGLIPFGKREHPLEAKLSALESRLLGVHSMEYEGFVNVFDHQQALIGGVQLQRRWNSCKLFSLWVDEAYRSLGIGQQILLVAQDLCLNMGAEVLLLETSTLHNVQFYLNRGFHIISELDDVIPGEKFFMLHKNLLATQQEPMAEDIAVSGQADNV